jgi:hypothetical protein
MHGQDSIVRLLIKHGVKPGIVGGWISQEDVEEEENEEQEENEREGEEWEGEEEDEGEDPPFFIGGDEDLGYPLALAALRGHEAVIRTLLAHGLSAAAPMLEQGETPLWLRQAGVISLS